MAITNKELMLLQDNINMLDNSIKYLTGFASMSNDPQVRSLCDTMVRDHKSCIQTFAKYITNTTLS